MAEDIMDIFVGKMFENFMPMRVVAPEEIEKHIRRDLEQIYLKEGDEGVAKALNCVWAPETGTFDRIDEDGIIIDDN